MAAAVAAPVSPYPFDRRLPAQAGDQLGEVFAATQARAAQWRQDSTRLLRLELQRGAEELRRERACLEELRSDLHSAEQSTEAARKMKVEGSRLAEAMLQSAGAVRRRAEAAQATRDELRKAHGKRQQELQRQEGGLAECRRSAEAQEAEIESFLGLYRERLGLAVSRLAPRTVRLAFTLLDDADPSREFSLALGIDEELGYRVVQCTPKVPEVEPLLERLNSSSSCPTALPAFVCGMRRAFQKAAGAAGKCRP